MSNMRHREFRTQGAGCSGRAGKTMAFLRTVAAGLFWLGLLGLGRPALGGEAARKLVFIHHSCGENWLSDENGGLGKALGAAGYLVSDTNYGWGPGGIGDRTDIPNWPDWFCGEESSRALDALTRESKTHSPYVQTRPDPGGRNRIILFKSCFPNSALEGKPDDPPGPGEGLSVGAAKAVYVRLRKAFEARPDLFFAAITAPPLRDRSHAQNARAFNTWLVKEWLKDYSGKNIMVFDFYNVLTHKENHHRIRDGAVEYISDAGGNALAYPSDDDHPSAAGNRKATEEFVPLLNHYVSLWLPTAPAGKPEPATPAAAPEHREPAAPAQPAKLPPPADAAPAANLAADAKAWTVFQDEKVEKPMLAISSKTVGEVACLSVEFNIPAGSWAACARVQDAATDWSKQHGVAVRYLAPAGCRLILTVYENGPEGGLLHFECPLSEGTGEWQDARMAWGKFRQPEWQGDVNRAFKPNLSRGVALILHPDEKPVRGTFQIARIGVVEGNAPERNEK